jgi:hypothetical protein
VRPGRWRAVKVVLVEALEAQGEAREQVLVTAGDADLEPRREVEELLAGESTGT